MQHALGEMSASVWSKKETKQLKVEVKPVTFTSRVF